MVAGNDLEGIALAEPRSHVVAPLFLGTRPAVGKVAQSQSEIAVQTLDHLQHRIGLLGGAEVPRGRETHLRLCRLGGLRRWWNDPAALPAWQARRWWNAPAALPPWRARRRRRPRAAARPGWRPVPARASHSQRTNPRQDSGSPHGRPALGAPVASLGRSFRALELDRWPPIAHLFYFVGGGCEHEGVIEKDSEDIRAVSTEVAAARREAAMALARLAEISMKYADVRTASDRQDAAIPKPGRAKPGEFVADELSLMLREQPYAVRCLIARSRRLSTAMPTVWQAYRDGDLDAEQVRVIDRVARRVCEPLTLTAIDEQSVQAAQSRCPKQLARVAAALGGAAGTARLRTAAPAGARRTPSDRDSRRRRDGVCDRRGVRGRRGRDRRDARRGRPQPRRPGPPHRAATPLRPVRRPAARTAAPHRHR